MDNQQASVSRKCKQCGATKPITEYYRHGYTKSGDPRYEGACKECRRPILAEAGKRRYWMNPEQYRGYVRSYRERDPDKYRALDRASHARKKAKVLAAYGGPRCSCCGEDHLSMLTIDHINGDGARHRLEIGKGRKNVGSRMYQWLITNGFPPGYQVLCFNCNSSKHFNGGVCEHAINEASETIPKGSTRQAAGKSEAPR